MANDYHALQYGTDDDHDSHCCNPYYQQHRSPSSRPPSGGNSHCHRHSCQKSQSSCQSYEEPYTYRRLKYRPPSRSIISHKQRRSPSLNSSYGEDFPNQESHGGRSSSQLPYTEPSSQQQRLFNNSPISRSGSTVCPAPYLRSPFQSTRTDYAANDYNMSGSSRYNRTDGFGWHQFDSPGQLRALQRYDGSYERFSDHMVNKILERRSISRPPDRDVRQSENIDSYDSTRRLSPSRRSHSEQSPSVILTPYRSQDVRRIGITSPYSRIDSRYYARSDRSPVVAAGSRILQASSYPRSYYQHQMTPGRDIASLAQGTPQTPLEEYLRHPRHAPIQRPLEPSGVNRNVMKFSPLLFRSCSSGCTPTQENPQPGQRLSPGFDAVPPSPTCGPSGSFSSPIEINTPTPLNPFPIRDEHINTCPADYIDLRTPTTPLRSISMNDRLSDLPKIPKPQSRKPANTSKVLRTPQTPKRSRARRTTKTSKRAQKSEVKQSAMEETPDQFTSRQHRLEAALLEKERKATSIDLDQAIFGEIMDEIDTLNDEENAKATIEARRKGRAQFREEESKHQQRVVESKAKADEEKRRMSAKIREQRVHEKEREELMKRAKREETRKQQVIEEEKIKEIRRQKALEKIKHDRREEVTTAEAKNKERQRLESIQADNRALETLNQKRAEAKQRAEALRQYSLDRGPHAKLLFEPEPIENPLFVSNQSVATSNSTSPKMLRERFTANSIEPWSGRSRLQKERQAYEEEEHQRRMKASRDRMSVRYAQTSGDSGPSRPKKRSMAAPPAGPRKRQQMSLSGSQQFQDKQDSILPLVRTSVLQEVKRNPQRRAVQKEQLCVVKGKREKRENNGHKSKLLVVMPEDEAVLVDDTTMLNAIPQPSHAASKAQPPFAKIKKTTSHPTSKSVIQPKSKLSSIFSTVLQPPARPCSNAKPKSTKQKFPPRRTQILIKRDNSAQGTTSSKALAPKFAEPIISFLEEAELDLGVEDIHPDDKAILTIAGINLGCPDVVNCRLTLTPQIPPLTMEEAFYAKLALRLKLEQEGMIEPRGWVHPDDSDISDYDEHDSLPKNDNHRQAMKETAAATSGIQNGQPIIGSFVRDASETQTETGSISGCTITMFEDSRALTQADAGEKGHSSSSLFDAKGAPQAVDMDGGVGSGLTHQAKFGILNYRTPEPSPSLPFTSTDLIRVYQVVKIDSKQDVVNKADQVTKNIAREFTDYVLANNHAEKSFATHRGKNPSRISSSDTYKAGLFHGIIQKTHTHTTEITIEVGIKLVSKISKFGATTMSRRYPAKYYMIRTIHLSQVTEKDGTVVKERKSDLLGKGFTVREMANHDAAEYIIKYIKPLGANIDHVREHAESIKAIREARDKCNEAKVCIDIELEFGGQVPWLAGKGEISLTVVVEEKEWEGPLN